MKGNVPFAIPVASSDPRQKIQALAPAWMQPLFTYVTGKAGDEQPLWKNGEFGLYLVNAAKTGAGIALAAAATASVAAHGIGPAPLFTAFAGMTLVAGATRAANSVFNHHATHLSFDPPQFLERILKRWGSDSRKSWNRALGEFASAFFLTTPYAVYKGPHNLHHKAENLATLKDPDFRFLFDLGYRPGQPYEWYWRHTWRVSLSPRFHAMMIGVRLRDNFANADAGPGRLRFAKSLWAAILGLVALLTALFGPWVLGAFFLAYVVPVLFLANHNALIQLLSEHQWMRVDDSPDRRVRLDRKTHARYLAPKMPPEDLKGIVKGPHWAWWWAKFLVGSLFVREYVLPFDLPQHPAHHRKPGRDDWANAAYAIREETRAGNSPWPGHQEDWSLTASLAGVFSLLSSLPPLEEPHEPLSAEETADEIRQM